MSVGKIAAFTEAWNTAARQMATANMNFGFDLMRVAWSPWSRGGERVNAVSFPLPATAKM